MLLYNCKDKLASNINHETKGRKDETHESYRKVCHCGSSERQAGFDLAVSGLEQQARLLEVVKMHGMKPLTSATGSKGLEMGLDDINAETLKCEIGADIPRDFMLDGDEFTDHYKESEVKDND